MLYRSNNDYDYFKIFYFKLFKSHFGGARELVAPGLVFPHAAKSRSQATSFVCSGNTPSKAKAVRHSSSSIYQVLLDTIQHKKFLLQNIITNLTHRNIKGMENLFTGGSGWVPNELNWWATWVKKTNSKTAPTMLAP